MYYLIARVNPITKKINYYYSDSVKDKNQKLGGGYEVKAEIPNNVDINNIPTKKSSNKYKLIDSDRYDINELLKVNTPIGALNKVNDSFTVEPETKTFAETLEDAMQTNKESKKQTNEMNQLFRFGEIQNLPDEPIQKTYDQMHEDIQYNDDTTTIPQVLQGSKMARDADYETEKLVLSTKTLYDLFDEKIGKEVGTYMDIIKIIYDPNNLYPNIQDTIDTMAQLSKKFIRSLYLETNPKSSIDACIFVTLLIRLYTMNADIDFDKILPHVNKWFNDFIFLYMVDTEANVTREKNKTTQSIFAKIRKNMDNLIAAAVFVR